MLSGHKITEQTRFALQASLPKQTAGLGFRHFARNDKLEIFAVLCFGKVNVLGSNGVVILDQDGGTFDYMLQFPHIARPGMALKHAGSLRTELRRSHLHSCRHAGQEVLR